MTEGVRPAGSHLLAPDRLDRPFSDPLVSRLFPPLATGVHWGLERTVSALKALGDPHRAYPTLHVGGSNGKGSVATTLAAIMNASGLRAGCYTSPHLCSFRERMMVGGEPRTESEILAAAQEVQGVVLEYGLTFFEAVTVLGFQLFARSGVEVGIIEVGLGGRLDSTNVVSPAVAGVTNVAMDHAEYLGDTLPLIAREKAGIAKPGVPLVVGERDPGLLSIFREVADGVSAPLFEATPPSMSDIHIDAAHTDFAVDTRSWGPLSIRTPLVGRHQAANGAIAIEMLEHVPEAWRPDRRAVLEGATRVEHHGRDQVVVLDDGTWLLDVAHNTAGMQSLVDTIDRLDLPGPLVALVGILSDKDWHNILPPLFHRVDRAMLTLPPTAPPDRRWDPAHAASEIGALTDVHHDADFARAFASARSLAGTGTVIVTGSVHTVGAALRLLEREPLTDR